MSLILLVEDDETLRRAYLMILEREGYEVVHAGDGLAALQELEKHTPDLILLDLLMPRMGGVDFLKSLNEQKKDHFRIIVLSNFDNKEDIEEIMKLGAQGYVLKALTPPRELADMVKEAIAKPAPS